jgi:hypothetical protein
VSVVVGAARFLLSGPTCTEAILTGTQHELLKLLRTRVSLPPPQIDIMEGSSSNKRDQPSDRMVEPFLSNDQQQHLDDSILRLFPGVTKIAHHEKVFLLMTAVQKAKDHLDPTYADVEAARSLLVQQPEVLREVEQAWESKTFKDLIRLGILLIDPLTPVLILPLQKFFNIRIESVVVAMDNFTTLISWNHKVSLLSEI